MSDQDSISRDAAHDAAMSRAQRRYDSMLPEEGCCEVCGKYDCDLSAEPLCVHCGSDGNCGCDGHFAKVEISMLRDMVDYIIREYAAAASPTKKEIKLVEKLGGFFL